MTAQNQSTAAPPSQQPGIFNGTIVNLDPDLRDNTPPVCAAACNWRAKRSTAPYGVETAR